MSEVPFHTFRFDVEFVEHKVDKSGKDRKVSLCKGAFSECSGLEVSMEPFEIKEGGRNYGPHQRPGRVSFETVVLKRGITSSKDLWNWFELVNTGAYAYRLTATVTVRGPEGGPEGEQWKWRLDNCLPVKFKAPELQSTASEVGIEELHIAHEGLFLDQGKS